MTTTAADPARILAAERRRRGWMWVRLVAMGSVPPTVWAISRWHLLPDVPMCWFKMVTGRPCPGCGMTRSMLHLAQGDLVASLRMHPAGILLAAAFLAALGGTAVGLVRGGDPVVDFIARRGVFLTVALVALLLGLWVLRAFLVPEWSPDPIR